MYKIGTKIQAYIEYSDEIIKGNIISIGTHKGKKVYDLDNGRFVYDSQIMKTL